MFYYIAIKKIRKSFFLCIFYLYLKKRWSVFSFFFFSTYTQYHHHHRRRMSAEQAFQLLALVRQEQDAARQQNKAEQCNAEYRRLVQLRVCALTSTHVLSWPTVQEYYTRVRDRADVAGHECGDSECRPMSLRAGAHFSDPAHPEHRYEASGNTWICAVSLRRHMCDAHNVCEFTQASHGSRICAMTGLDKGVVPISVPHLATPAAISLAVHQEVSNEVSLLTRPPSSSGGGGGGKKRPCPKKPRAAAANVRQKTGGGEQGYELVERLNAAPSSHICNEIRSICERLFSPEHGVRRVCVDAMRSAIAAMNTELQRRLAQSKQFGLADLALLVAHHGLAPLKALMEIAPSLKPSRAAMPHEDLLYLSEAVSRLLHLLQLTPKMNDGCNSVSAKGARPNEMVVQLLMVLRDGLVGLVDRNDGSIRVCTQAQAELDRVAVTNVDADYTRYVFVEAHPALRHLLPDALPPGVTGAVAELYQHTQAHDNRIRTSFASVLSKPGVEPHRYCLATYMAVRADVMSSRLMPSPPEHAAAV